MAIANPSDRAGMADPRAHWLAQQIALEQSEKRRRDDGVRLRDLLTEFEQRYPLLVCTVVDGRARVALREFAS